MADQPSMTIDLPWPPTANRYWRNVAGRMVLSRDGRRYREAVAGLVWRHLQQEGGGIGFGESDLEVTIEAYPPDRRRRDLDNILKALIDALESVDLFHDDSQIAVISICRREAEPPGRVEVTLRAVSPEDVTMAEKPTSAGTGQKRCAGRSRRPLS